MKQLAKINEKEVLSLISDVKTMMESEEFLNLKIDSADDVESASNFLSTISKATKQIESKRKEITSPYVLWKRETDSFFKVTIAPLKAADALVRGKILAWRRADQIRIQKEEDRRRKIQEAHAKKGHKVNAPVEMMQTEQTIGKASTQKVWRFEITNFSKVPIEFMTIDEKAVKLAIKNGTTKIEGLRIYQEERLRIN